mgnify:CR=1 FL=1
MTNASGTFFSGVISKYYCSVVVAVISPRHQYGTKIIRGYQLSPAVSSPLAQALGAIESKYEKWFTDSKVNKRFKSQYARLRIRGTPENTDTV